MRQFEQPHYVQGGLASVHRHNDGEVLPCAAGQELDQAARYTARSADTSNIDFKCCVFQAPSTTADPINMPILSNLDTFACVLLDFGKCVPKKSAVPSVWSV